MDFMTMVRSRIACRGMDFVKVSENAEVRNERRRLDKNRREHDRYWSLHPEERRELSKAKRRRSLELHGVGWRDEYDRRYEQSVKGIRNRWKHNKGQGSRVRTYRDRCMLEDPDGWRERNREYQRHSRTRRRLSALWHVLVSIPSVDVLAHSYM